MKALLIHPPHDAVEAKCAEIRSQARRMASSIKNNFGVEIMKIPKKIRSMSVTEFMNECGGDIGTVLARNKDRALAARNARGKACVPLRAPTAATRCTNPTHTPSLPTQWCCCCYHPQGACWTWCHACCWHCCWWRHSEGAPRPLPVTTPPTLTCPPHALSTACSSGPQCSTLHPGRPSAGPHGHPHRL